MLTYEQADDLALRYAERLIERDRLNATDTLLQVECMYKFLGFDCTFGVEYVAVGDRELAYLNVGESYTTTIGIEDNFPLLTSWAGWYEEAEQEYEEDTYTLRCAYCGEYADRGDDTEWNLTECHCGHYVDGTEIQDKSFIIEIGHEHASACTLEGDALSGELLEDMLDCNKSGDCESACQYVLDTYSPAFRIVKEIGGEYQNVLASAEDKQAVCEAIYFESESDFTDESLSELYLVWESAATIEAFSI